MFSGFIPLNFKMTPTFCWVFLLALVGRAASIPQPLVVDACALLCNPGAETESEQARDPVLYPRYPKVDCKLQSDSEDAQAWVISSQCMKLCNRELTTTLEVNCFALRSSLGAHLGCFCEALTPLSPNTMRLHESWRLNYLVKELARDILDVITDSPLDKIILCELHREFFKDTQLKKTPNGKLESCFMNSTEQGDSTRTTRDVKGIKGILDDDLVKDPILLPDIPKTKDKGEKEPIPEIPIEEPIDTEKPIEEPITTSPEMPIDHNDDNDEMDVENTFFVKPQEKISKEKKDKPHLERICTECLEYCESKKDDFSKGKLDKDDIHHVFCSNCELIESKCKNLLVYKLSQ